MAMRKAEHQTNKISGKQIALLHLAKKHLALDDDIYRAVLARYGNRESAADLDARGFASVMKYFTALGFRSTWTQRTFGNRAGMATPPQIDLIRSLWRQFANSEDPNDAGLNGWLHKHHHIGALRFVDTAKASKVIFALKAMVDRKQDQI